MSEVQSALLKVLDYIADTGNMKVLEEKIKIVSGQRYTEMTPPRSRV